MTNIFLKIKDSYMRAWRGEESLKSVFLKWGLTSLLLLIINFLLFLAMVIIFMYVDTAAFIIGALMLLNYIFIYALLILIQKNIKLKNIFYKIPIHLLFIIFYLLLLKPINLAWDLFTIFA